MPTDKIFGLFFFYCVNDFAKILVHLHIHPVITFVNFDVLPPSFFHNIKTLCIVTV
jgi:hypothetical protein